MMTSISNTTIRPEIVKKNYRNEKYDWIFVFIVLWWIANDECRHESIHYSFPETNREQSIRRDTTRDNRE